MGGVCYNFPEREWTQEEFERHLKWVRDFNLRTALFFGVGLAVSAVLLPVVGLLALALR